MPAQGDLAGLRFVASAAESLGDHALAARSLAAAAVVARQQGRLGLITRLQALQAWTSKNDTFKNVPIAVFVSSDNPAIEQARKVAIKELNVPKPEK